MNVRLLIIVAIGVTSAMLPITGYYTLGIPAVITGGISFVLLFVVFVLVRSPHLLDGIAARYDD